MNVPRALAELMYLTPFPLILEEIKKKKLVNINQSMYFFATIMKKKCQKNIDLNMKNKN